MIEKRFTIKPQDDLFGITDNNSADKVNVINGIRTEIEAEWLCKDMNTLNDACRSYEKQITKLEEENEQLNKKLQIYKSDGLETLNDLQRCYENAKKSMKRIDVLKEENERLKQEIEILQEQIAHFDIGDVE